MAYGFKLSPALNGKTTLQYVLFKVKACQSDWKRNQTRDKSKKCAFLTNLLLLGFTTLFNMLGHQRRFRHRA